MSSYQQPYPMQGGAPFPGQPSPHGSAASYYGHGAPTAPYGAAPQMAGGYGYGQEPYYGRTGMAMASMPPAPGMMSEREHERATKDWQKQMKQSQKEAEKRARKEAKEAEKFKAQWEKGQREREKAEEKEARELERARMRDRERNGVSSANGSLAGHQRSVSAAVIPGIAAGPMPGGTTRQRKLSNAMGFDKYGDTLAAQMGAMTLGEQTAALDPTGARERRERRTSTAGPPPPGVGRARRHSNAAYDDADGVAGYDRRAAAAQQAQDDAYARAARNAHYVQDARSDPAVAAAAYDPRAREYVRERDRAAREREYAVAAAREQEDPYAAGPAVPGAYPTGASRSPYEDPMRAPVGGVPGAPVDPYAAAGASAYARPSAGAAYAAAPSAYGAAAPAAYGAAGPAPYGAAPPVAGAHHSPSGYPSAITPSHSPYARDMAAGAGAGAVHDPYAAPATNASYYGSAGASRYGGAPGYDRSPYGAAAHGPPALGSTVPGAAAAAGAGSYYSSRSPHDPYAAAPAPAPYGGAGRSPYDRHSAPPAPRGEPYPGVPGAAAGAYGHEVSPYDRQPAYGAPTAYGNPGSRAPSPLPYGAAPGGRAPSPLPYGAAGVAGREPSPMRYPQRAAAAYAQHVQDGDPSGMGGRGAGYDAYGQRGAGGGGGGYEPAPPSPGPMPSSPPGFHRQPSQNHKYTPFEAFLILDDLDGFYRETPHMPAALVSHDVFHEDWIRFMQDLAFAWSGRIPAPELGHNGNPPHGGAIVADLVDVWNMRFFHPRRVELIVYHGRAHVSGRRGVPCEEDDYSPRKWSLCLRCLSGPPPAAGGPPPPPLGGGAYA